MHTWTESPRRFLALAICIAGAGFLAHGAADDEPEGKAGPADFVRFVPGGLGEGKLETAIATYVGDGGVEVDLVAAVHIADGDYYRKLEERFAGYDSLLYEMIKPPDVELKRGERSGGVLSAFQRGLKDVLKLEFQLDAVDYSKKNFVHADLDPETFFRLQKERGESLIGFLLKVMLRDLGRQMKGEVKERANMFEIITAFASKDSARKLKLVFARELEDIERTLAGVDGEESVIVEERNKAALKALSSALKEGKKKMGIFYGGAHMPDMEKRLMEGFGLRRSKVEWVTAWEIRKKDGGESKETGEAKKPGEGRGEPESSAGDIELGKP